MDEHLDTSWCPVCDRLILPKRYTVPVAPVAPPVPPQPIRASSPAPSALRASQTTRGKNGTIKARPNAHGGGLVHGTGRVRPGGGLRRDNTVKLNKSPTKVAQLLPEPQLPPAPVKTRTVIDQSQTPLYCSEECRGQDRHLDMSKLPMDLYHEDRPFSPHPAFLNPASRSPPPASPTLPPVPPNSWSARLSDAEQSDSSSATSTSYGTSSHGQPSPTDEPPRPRVQRQDSWDFSAHPIPPPIPPMPLHPHRPQAAVDPLRHCKPKVERENGGYNGGIMMAARRLASLLHPPRESTELSPPSIPSIFGFGAAPKPKVDVTSKKEKRNSAPAAPFDWQALVYNYGTPSDERASFGSPSRESNVVKEEPAPPPRRPSPSRAQSVAELYAKYPLRTTLSRPAPSRSNSLASLPTTSTSYDTSYASTTQARSLERENIRSPTFSTGSEHSERRRRRRHEPRSLLPPGAEGKLLVPDVKLKRFSASSPTQPPPRPLSTASFAESASAYSGTSGRSRVSLSRNQSEASIARSQLGSVREEESDASTARHRKRRDRLSMISTEECNGPSSLPERRRLAMESRTWSYDNVAMPTYPVMPAIPVKQIRHEKVFIADGDDISQTISQRPLNADEKDRKDTEVSRKRGEKEGKEGWWVNLESEVMVIPERKRLFLFAGK